MTDEEKKAAQAQEKAERIARERERRVLVIRNRETAARIERARLNGDRTFRILR